MKLTPEERAKVTDTLSRMANDCENLSVLTAGQGYGVAFELWINEAAHVLKVCAELAREKQSGEYGKEEN